jgi:hypothetical protein
MISRAKEKELAEKKMADEMLNRKRQQAEPDILVQGGVSSLDIGGRRVYITTGSMSAGVSGSVHIIGGNSGMSVHELSGSVSVVSGSGAGGAGGGSIGLTNGAGDGVGNVAFMAAAPMAMADGEAMGASRRKSRGLSMEPTSVPSGAPTSQPSASSSESQAATSSSPQSPHHSAPATSTSGRPGAVSPGPDDGKWYDLTTLPNTLQQRFEAVLGADSIIRPSIVSAGDVWTMKSYANLFAQPGSRALLAEQQREEKLKTFGLLDALTKSGALHIDDASVHVVVASVHMFDNTLMDTIVQENVNPIEKIELSSLVMASVVLDSSVEELVHDVDAKNRIQSHFNALTSSQQ